MNEFEVAVVNEPSVFELSRFYCNNQGTANNKLQGRVLGRFTGFWSTNPHSSYLYLINARTLCMIEHMKISNLLFSYG